MATHKDNRGDRAGHATHGSYGYGLRQHSQTPWLPMPQAPANDNEADLRGLVYAFLGRHLNWIAPTLLLAAFSVLLLFLRS